VPDEDQPAGIGSVVSGVDDSEGHRAARGIQVLVQPGDEVGRGRSGCPDVSADRDHDDGPLVGDGTGFVRIEADIGTQATGEDHDEG
jgi:hypothetical protein